MDSDRITRLLTLLANTGVIVGIVFLALEMQQTSAIATAEARLEYSAGWRSVDESRQDESFSKLLVKSIEAPEELSMAEFVRLDGYYSGILDQMLSAQTARATGIVEGPFAEVANSIGAIYFSNDFARSWWKHVRSEWSEPSDGGFQQVVNDAISAGELGRTQRIYEGIMGELTPQPESTVD
ncbi:MAG: hypothetical protein ABJ056_10485 [Halioglobus sp.]